MCFFQFIWPKQWSNTLLKKINDFHRSHIIIKTNKPFSFQNYYIQNLNINKIISNIKGVKFRIDVDPLSLL